MAADHRHDAPAPDPTGRPPGRIRTAQPPGRRVDVPDGRRATPLERRIELVRLRARVAALERSLAQRERNRQALVDHYELLLEERERDMDGREGSSTADRPEGASATPLDRLCDRLRALRPPRSLGLPTP